MFSLFPGPYLQAKDLVSKLCVVDLSHRYGMMAHGIDDIKVISCKYGLPRHPPLLTSRFMSHMVS
jgi:hypothetical protein